MSNTKRPFRPRQMVECPHCEGEGEEPGIPDGWSPAEKLCSLCGGTCKVTAEVAQDYADAEEEDDAEEALETR